MHVNGKTSQDHNYLRADRITIQMKVHPTRVIFNYMKAVTTLYFNRLMRRLCRLSSLTISGVLDTGLDVFTSYWLVFIAGRVYYRFANTCHINKYSNTLRIHLNGKRKQVKVTMKRCSKHCAVIEGRNIRVFGILMSC